MKMNLKYTMIRKTVWFSTLIILFATLSCKDDKKDTGSLSLNVSQLQVPVDGLALVRVSGVESFAVEFTTSGLVDAVVSDMTIRITGIKTGSTTMTVKASNGGSKTCLITVTPSSEETDFTNSETPRIEGWKSTTVYTESQPGSTFSRHKNANALGETKNGNTTFEYAVLGDDFNFFRASASGNYTSASVLEDGLVVIQENGQMQYLIANGVKVNRYSKNKVWLTFKFPDRKDIRLVTEVVD